jgi:hypothetical protein
MEYLASVRRHSIIGSRAGPGDRIRDVTGTGGIIAGRVAAAFVAGIRVRG